MQLRPDMPLVIEGRDPLLEEREKTHGNWKLQSAATNEIKQAIHKWDTRGLKHSQIEALDMIATKIGRILGGNSNHKDHWDDIAGYAKLGAESCND